MGVLAPREAAESSHISLGLHLNLVSCLKVAAQNEPGPTAILGVHGGVKVYAPRGTTLRSLEDQGVEHAVVRVNFRALPSRPRLLTVRLWLVAPGMLDY